MSGGNLTVNGQMSDIAKQALSGLNLKIDPSGQPSLNIETPIPEPVKTQNGNVPAPAPQPQPQPDNGFDPDSYMAKFKEKFEPPKSDPPPAQNTTPSPDKPETPPTSDTPDPIAAQDTGSEDKDKGAEASWKDMRKKLSETSKTLTDKEAELEAARKELEDYKNGVKLPEILQEKENKINELSQYERLVNFKASQEYKEKYIQPIDQAKAKLREIATEYEIPEEYIEDTINQALNLKKAPELNRFLSNYFDAVGAEEFKNNIRTIRDTQVQAVEAEKEPAKALEELQSQNTAIQIEAKAKRAREIEADSKGAWVESLLEIRNKGDILELILKDGDSAHNEKVQPIITQAGTEFGRLVKAIETEGLSKNVIKALAKMVQLAHASALAIPTRNQALKELHELQANLQRDTNYLRPQVGGNYAGSGNGAVPSSKQEMTPQTAARTLINTILPELR